MKKTPTSRPFTKKEHRVYAFIDGQNLYRSVTEQGWKLDFRKFRRYLTDKLQVSRAFYFIGYISENEQLYTGLQKYGYIVIFKPTLRLRNGRIKGNVDAELVMHTMVEYPNYDQAVIVAGDGDYYCLLNYLQAKGKLSKLIVPNKDSYSSLLRKFADKRLFLSDLKKRLALSEPKKRG